MGRALEMQPAQCADGRRIRVVVLDPSHIQTRLRKARSVESFAKPPPRIAKSCRGQDKNVWDQCRFKFHAILLPDALSFAKDFIKLARCLLDFPARVRI